MITIMPEEFEGCLREADYAAYEAWRDAWNDDDRLLAAIPPGYWYDFVLISFLKRLLMGKMPDDLRLRFLEMLHACVSGLISIDTMRRVDPACAVAAKMMEETLKLHVSDQCTVMRKWNVMASFCNLNSSLIAAMRLIPGITPFSRNKAA